MLPDRQTIVLHRSSCADLREFHPPDPSHLLGWDTVEEGMRAAAGMAYSTTFCINCCTRDEYRFYIAWQIVKGDHPGIVAAGLAVSSGMNLDRAVDLVHEIHLELWEDPPLPRSRAASPITARPAGSPPQPGPTTPGPKVPRGNRSNHHRNHRHCRPGRRPQGHFLTRKPSTGSTNDTRVPRKRRAKE